MAGVLTKLNDDCLFRQSSVGCACTLDQVFADSLYHTSADAQLTDCSLSLSVHYKIDMSSYLQHSTGTSTRTNQNSRTKVTTCVLNVYVQQFQKCTGYIGLTPVTYSRIELLHMDNAWITF